MASRSRTDCIRETSGTADTFYANLLFAKTHDISILRMRDLHLELIFATLLIKVFSCFSINLVKVVKLDEIDIKINNKTFMKYFLKTLCRRK